MSITERLSRGFVILTAGWGLCCTPRLSAGVLPETWNITHPEIVTEVHREYVRSGPRLSRQTPSAPTGSNTVQKPVSFALKMLSAGICCAKAAVGDTGALVALDVGPLGKVVGWPGGVGFEEAVGYFSETIRIGAEAGADFVLVETMNDIYELKAAVLAAKEACDLPVVATVVFDASGRMMSGSNPAAVVALLEGLGVAALGMNCSLGPEQMKNILPEMQKYASVPVVVQPNAGMPHLEDRKTVYDVSPPNMPHMREMANRRPGLGAAAAPRPNISGSW